MQIHEVTRPPLQEGVLGDIGRSIVSAAGGPDIPQSQSGLAKDAAKSAADLAKKGYGPGGPDPDSDLAKSLSTDWKVKLQNIQKDPAIAQYLNGLLQGWSKQAEKLNAVQAQPAQTQPSQKPTVKPGQVQPTPTITIGSVGLLTKGDDGLWYNEQGRAVTDPQQAAKIDKAYQAQEYRKGQSKMTAVVKEARKPSIGPLSARRKKTATKQSQAQPAVPQDPYREAFVTWTDANLASKDSYYNTITMKDVRANVSGISQVLDQKLDAVVQTRGTPQSAQAIKDYLQVAVAGVQARSQELKNKTPQATMAAMGAAQAASGNVRQAMAQSGVNPTALKSFGTKLKSRQATSTNNPELDAMLADMGVRVA